MSLLSLPQDVLFLICEYLAWPQIFMLSRTNRCFHARLGVEFWNKKIKILAPNSKGGWRGFLGYLRLRFQEDLKNYHRELRRIGNCSAYENQLLKSALDDANYISRTLIRRAQKVSSFNIRTVNLQVFQVQKQKQFPTSKYDKLLSGQMALWIASESKKHRFALFFSFGKIVERVDCVFTMQGSVLILNSPAAFVSFCQENYLTRKTAAEVYQLSSLIIQVQPYFTTRIEQVVFRGTSSWI